MRIQTMTRLATITLLALGSGHAALAAGPQQGAAEPTPEMRRQMAAVHQKMADCLKSDRPIGECRVEMHKSCVELMGEESCPMMGMMGGMGPGMMGHGMMHQQGSSPAGTSPPPK
jgi:hypothetical protein